VAGKQVKEKVREMSTRKMSVRKNRGAGGA